MEKIKKIVENTDNIVTPKNSKAIYEKKLKVEYHITLARKIIHKMDMSSKTVQRVHVNKPEIEEIERWQRSAKRQILRLESKDFTVLALDEGIFIDDQAKGAKYWSPKVEPIITPYSDEIMFLRCIQNIT